MPPKMTLPQAAEEAPKLDPSLAPLAEKYRAADNKLKKTPGDAAVKKAFVQSAYDFGHGAEYSDVLEPRIKYRAALKLYRRR